MDKKKNQSKNLGLVNSSYNNFDIHSVVFGHHSACGTTCAELAINSVVARIHLKRHNYNEKSQNKKNTMNGKKRKLEEVDCENVVARNAVKRKYKEKIIKLKDPKELIGKSQTKTKLIDVPEATTKLIDTPEATTKLIDTPEATTKLLDTPETTMNLVDTSQSIIKLMDTPETTTKLMDTPQTTTKLMDIPQTATKSMDTLQTTAKSKDTSQTTTKSMDTPQATTEVLDVVRKRGRPRKNPITSDVVLKPKRKPKPILNTVNHVNSSKCLNGDKNEESLKFHSTRTRKPNPKFQDYVLSSNFGPPSPEPLSKEKEYTPKSKIKLPSPEPLSKEKGYTPKSKFKLPSPEPLSEEKEYTPKPKFKLPEVRNDSIEDDPLALPENDDEVRSFLPVFDDTPKYSNIVILPKGDIFVSPISKNKNHEEKENTVSDELINEHINSDVDEYLTTDNKNSTKYKKSTRDDKKSTKDDKQTANKDKYSTRDDKNSKKDTNPTKDDTNLTKDDTNSTNDDTNSTKDDTNKTNDDTNSIKDDTNLTKDDTNLINDDTNLIKDDTNSVKDDTNSRDDYTNPTKDIKKSTKNDYIQTTKEPKIVPKGSNKPKSVQKSKMPINNGSKNTAKLKEETTYILVDNLSAYSQNRTTKSCAVDFNKLVRSLKSVKLPAPNWKIRIVVSRQQTINEVAFTNKEALERCVKFSRIYPGYTITFGKSTVKLLGSPYKISSFNDISILLDIVHSIAVDDPVLEYSNDERL